MLLAVVAFLTMATTASAQFVQSNASAPASSGNIFASMPTDGYNRVYFSYNPVSASWSENASFNKKLSKLSLFEPFFESFCKFLYFNLKEGQTRGNYLRKLTKFHMAARSYDTHRRHCVRRLRLRIRICKYPY